MTTITLSVSASSDDWITNEVLDSGTDTAFAFGGVGTAPLPSFGQGWRFVNVPLAGTDTVTAAYLYLVRTLSPPRTCI